MARPKQQRVTGRVRPSWGYRAPKKGHYHLFGLRRLRLEREWSQDELAERAGVSRPMISMLETGAQRGSPRTIPKLARALGVPPKELLMSESLAAAELQRWRDSEVERDVG